MTARTAANDTAAVVLAAGGGSRFPGTKQLAEVDGLPLVAHAVAAAHAADITQVLVVVGHDAKRVARAAGRGGHAWIVSNPDHGLGQASSLRAGITAASALADVEVLVVLLGDQPRIAPQAVRAVSQAVRFGADAARARYDDGPGHPVAFARRVWPRLAAVQGDVGARNVLATLEVIEVPIAGATPPDVDTAADLRHLSGEAAGT